MKSHLKALHSFLARWFLLHRLEVLIKVVWLIVIVASLLLPGLAPVLAQVEGTPSGEMPALSDTLTPTETPTLAETASPSGDELAEEVSPPLETPPATPVPTETPLSPPPETTEAVQSPNVEALSGKIDPEVWAALQSDPAGRVRVIVYMAEQTDLDKLAADQASIQSGDPLADREALRQQVYQSLKQTAQETQGHALALLQSQGASIQSDEIQSYWIFNGLAGPVDRATALALAALPEVAYIYPDRLVQLPPEERLSGDVSITSIEWNISKIKANQVWSTLGITGSGAVVGSIDTGVYWEHSALKNKYRGWNGTSANHTYSWVDVVGGGLIPYDDEDHGTHTVGTMVGDDGGSNQIGVAPGAKWIAAKALDAGGSGYYSWLLSAMQWMQAPGGDPTMAPDVVNNSWGGGCDAYFRSAIASWRAVSIVPIFANGNTGPSSGSVNGPACVPEAIGVGATDSGDYMAYFSSRGPSPWGEIKPEVSAPGVSIRSSIKNGFYATWNGTSMAAPHVAGVVALMRSADPSLSVDEIETILKNTAVDYGASGPDNAYGWGRIDALAAVSLVRPSWSYDDTNPALTYSGSGWKTYNNTGPFSNTLRYSDTIGSSASMTFSGDRLILGYTGASNRGVMRIQIDSGTPIDLNQYTSTLQWQKWWVSPSLSNGTHTITMTHLSGAYVDVDFIIALGSSQPALGAAGKGVYDDRATTYSTGWVMWTGSGPSNNTLHYSSKTGNTAHFAFYGQRVKVLYSSYPEYGEMTVQVDSNPPETINQYSAARQWGRQWDSGPLTDGLHTLTLTHSSGKYVVIDGLIISGCNNLTLQYVGNGSAPTASPPNSTTCASGRYLGGEAITLTANPAAGHHLDYWSGTNNALSNQLTMPDQDHTVTAYYLVNATPGIYDNTSPQLRYSGTWATYSGSGPTNNTLHYSSVIGSTARFWFTGKRVKVVYYAHPLYGNMSVQIDSQPVVTVSQYASSGQWQRVWTSEVLAEGDHSVVITHSSGSYISLDGFVVTNPVCRVLTLNGTIGGSAPTAAPTNSAGCPQGQYYEGEEITLTADPGAGYHLDSWSGTSGAQSNVLTMPDADHVVTANYAANAGVGTYDNTSEQIRYSGTWGLYRGTGPTNNTLHYSSVIGSTARFWFTGKRVKVVYYAHPLYGNMSVQIDSQPAVTVSQYASSGQWQRVWTSEVLAEGDHSVVITHSSGSYISLDGFVVTNPVCRVLTLNGTIGGSAPTAAPTNSAGCPQGQYYEGEEITLTADPGAGYHLDSWSGTSGAQSNVLTMPDADHVVTANYVANAGVGTYDNTSAHFVYSSGWLTWNGSGPTNNIMHYSSSNGRTASFIFTGRRLSLIFAGHPSYGSMRIRIDSDPEVLLSQNASAMQWQLEWNSAALTAGDHTVTLTHASGTYVTLDGAVVSDTVPAQSWCTSSSNSAAQDGIVRVQLNSADKSSARQVYQDYSRLPFTTLTAGNAYTLFITGQNTSNRLEYLQAWIDFNQDSDFDDAGETINLGSATFSGTRLFSQTFIVPSGAVDGNTRLRVVLRYAAAPAACGTYTFGETEDYTVTIQH